MQKHTLLALLSLITSFICWVIFDSFALSPNGIGQDMLVILAIDRVVKSLCIILMYKFYERVFTKCCCCFLKCTHAACVSKKVKELFPYFDPNPTLHTSTIYAQCHKVVALEDVYGEDVSVKEEEVRALDHLDIPSSPDDTNDDNDINMNKRRSITPSPVPNKPLPQFPGQRLGINKRSVASNSISSANANNREISRSYEKALPQIDFGVNPYKMLNFIACLTDPQNKRLRFLNYSNTGYNIIPTHIFNEIDQQFDGNIDQGIVIMEGYQFDQNKFSFLRKSKTKYPYKLAIRLKDHHLHIDDAHKLLKYAEYKLNEVSKQIKPNATFDYEPYFDQVAKDLSSGKNITNGGHANFMTFDGSAEAFALQRPSVQVSWSRQGSRDMSRSNDPNQLQMHQTNHHLRGSTASAISAYSGNHNGGPPIHNRQLTPSIHYQPKPLPPITPLQSLSYQVTDEK